MTAFRTVAEMNTHLIQLCRNERKLTHEILTHIQLFEKCGGPLKMGFSSMHQYLTRQLGYSDDQAFRRLKAARLLNEFPEVAEKLKDGSLNLSQAAQAQSSFEAAQRDSAKPVSQETKQTLLLAIEKANNFETKALLAKALDLPLQKEDRIKAQADESIRLEITLNKEQFEKLKEAKSLLSHQIPSQNTAEVLEAVLEFFLEKKRGKILKNTSTKRVSTETIQPGVDGVVTAESRVREKEKTGLEDPALETVTPKMRASQGATTQSTVINSEDRLETKKPCNKRSRYISVQTKQELWRRSGGCCEYRSAKGERCGNRYQLQLDHNIPFSQNGSSQISNMALLCSQHNSWKATEQGIGFETTSFFPSNEYHCQRTAP